MNGPAILAKLWEMGRKQEAAKTCTAAPVTLFQVARYQVVNLPDGMDYCQEAEAFIVREDGHFLPRFVRAKQAEFEEAESSEEREPPTFTAFDFYESGAIAGDHDCPVAIVEWRTLHVFGSVEEAVAFGEQTAYRYRAAERGNGELGRDWRTYTVPAAGLLGEIVSAGIKNAIEEATNAD